MKKKKLLVSGSLLVVIIFSLLAYYLISQNYFFGIKNDNDKFSDLISPVDDKVVDIKINGQDGVVNLSSSASYAVEWIVPKQGNCMLFGYFGDDTVGSSWKAVNENGQAVLKDVKGRFVKSYLYALDCSVNGIQVGDMGQVDIKQ